MSLLAAVATVLILTACGSSESNESAQGDSRDAGQATSEGPEIAFVRDEGIGGRISSAIYVMRADGSGQRKLTEDPNAVDSQPAFSPDGKRLAFTRSDDTGRANEEIWVMNADGTDQRNLTRSPGTVDTSPEFSPDGEQLAFLSDRDGGGIYLISVDGTQVRRVTDTGGPPAFSPNGQQIAFTDVGPSNDDEALDIHVVNADGSKRVNLTDSRRIWAESPAFSPDGELIAFLRARRATLDRQVWMMDADGRNRARLPGRASPGSSLAFSPDGEQMAFAWAGGRNPGIYVADTDGSDVMRVPDTEPDDGSPAWSPASDRSP